MNEKRDFKGIWIPKSIWLNKSISVLKKVFLSEIDSLDNEDGCYASNEYFSEFFDISIRTSQRIILELIKDGFIDREIIYKENSKEISHRILRVKSLNPSKKKGKITPMTKLAHPHDKSGVTPMTKLAHPHDKSGVDNNTDYNKEYNKVENQNSKPKNPKIKTEEERKERRWKEIELQIGSRQATNLKACHLVKQLDEIGQKTLLDFLKFCNENSTPIRGYTQLEKFVGNMLAYTKKHNSEIVKQFIDEQIGNAKNVFYWSNIQFMLNKKESENPNKATYTPPKNVFKPKPEEPHDPEKYERIKKMIQSAIQK